MDKRKIGDCESDISYVVIETTNKNDGVFVQFIPYSWLKPIKSNAKIVSRAAAQYYFPRRLPGQTIDQHAKFVKNAKFVGMSPQDNNNWELLKCRVLKIGLGCIDDAITAEKMFSDYFDTTEAEKELERAGKESQTTTKPKRVRKTKKPPVKKVQSEVSSNDSESENETAGTTEVISDYNTALEAMQEQLGEDGNNNEQHQQEMTQYIQNDVSQLYPQGTVFQLLDQNQLHLQNEFTQEPENSSNCCNCKGIEKLRNKMDYFQKRVMNEISEIESVVKQRSKSSGEAVKENAKTSTVVCTDTAAVKRNQELDTPNRNNNYQDNQEVADKVNEIQAGTELSPADGETFNADSFINT